MLALTPSPAPAKAYNDPIVLKTPQIALEAPIATQLKEQAPLPVPVPIVETRSAPIIAPTTFANGYDWGNCTYGVASWIRVPGDLGNANTWDDKARLEGYMVTSVPKPGSVAQTDAGYYGHVALVEAVNGSQVLIKEMNSLGLGAIDERWVPEGTFNYIYF